MVQLTTFSNLKPWFVKCQKEWNTVCYKYHIELVELKLASTTCVPKMEAHMQIVIVSVRVFVAQ
jgi:hypothetical protein